MSNEMELMVISAHPDDEIFGAGGTIARYAQEGKHITSIVLSYGETSHFWLQRKFSAEIRVKELKKAEAIVGCQESMFFGFAEGKFNDSFSKKRIREQIKKIILDKNPSKIFTHSGDDPHPDHRATYIFVAHLVGILRELGKNIDVYSFDVWNPWNIVKRNNPKLVVDISSTFHLKTKALGTFESQKYNALIPLMWSVYVRAFVYGLDYGCRYAEVFYKVR